MNKLEDLINAANLGSLIDKKEDEKKKHKYVCIFAVIGVIAAISAIAIAIYKYLSPDYFEDFDDDFEDDPDEDFFEDEDLD